MAITIFTDCDGNSFDLTVEIGLTSSTSSFAIWNSSLWDTGIWGPDHIWTDVSDYVTGITTNRAFDGQFRSWSAGSISVTLNNQDGRFSPDNLLGPYVAAGISSIIPGLPIRARVDYASITYQLFYGRIDEWVESFKLFGDDGCGDRIGQATMTCSGSDAWKKLASASSAAVSPSVGAGEYFGARVQRVLDSAGFTDSTDLDVGYVPLQATDLSSKPTEELEVTAASEGGHVWVDADGTVIGRDRYALVEDPRSITPQVVFGDDGLSEIQWFSIQVSSLSLSGVINAAVYSRVGGSEQAYYDQPSIALYGKIADTSSWIDKLLCTTDPEVATLAQWTVMTHKDPAIAVEGLSLRPRYDPDVLVPIALGLQICDLVEVNIRPPSAYGHMISRRCFVSGIGISISSGDVTVSYSFSPANLYQTYANSLWDVGLWGASDVDANGARFFV